MGAEQRGCQGREGTHGGHYFRIRRDATISIARITLSDSDRREQRGIPVQKLCAWWSTCHRW